MKFVIIGINGRMGQILKQAIVNSQDIFIAGVDVVKDEDNHTFTSVHNIKEQFDAIIDFSTASCRRDILSYCVNNHVLYGCFSTIISDEDLVLMKKLSKTTPVLICDNASEGVQLLKKITRLLAESSLTADFILNEYHHKEKKDSPSGTAKSLINILNEKNVNCKTVSHRAGTEVGTHSLQIFLNNENLTITHTASNRNIFALGAIKLMHKLATKKKGFYVNEIK